MKGKAMEVVAKKKKKKKSLWTKENNIYREIITAKYRRIATNTIR